MLILTFQLGNVGLNLTEAKCVILADFGHNPNEIQQAISRCVRIGQNSPVRVVWVTCNEHEKFERI